MVFPTRIWSGIRNNLIWNGKTSSAEGLLAADTALLNQWKEAQAMAFSRPGLVSSLRVECLAFWDAIWWARERRWDSVIFGLDSLLVVQAFQSEDVDCSSVGLVIDG
ncbi:conserved hypothetical protein, partial [Ricinus communis]